MSASKKTIIISMDATILVGGFVFSSCRDAKRGAGVWSCGRGQEVSADV